MIIAALGDIDGEAAALALALDSIDNEGIMTCFCTGNLAGPEGADEVIRLLQQREVLAAQGERDRMLLRFQQKAQQLRGKMSSAEFQGLETTHSNMSSSALEYLRAMHKRVERRVDGIRVMACHGSPSSQEELITPETPHARLQRLRESVEAEIILCGGGPRHFHRWVSGVLFAGLAPLRAQDGTVSYTLVNTEEEPWQVRQVVL